MSIRNADNVLAVDGIDSQVGRNVQRLRSDRLSQTELASLMRERGWKWTQPTVVAVENGTRPLKIGEVKDLADIFNRSILEIVSRSDVAAEAAELGRRAAMADAELLAAMATYDEARLHLAVQLERVPQAEMTGHLVALGDSWIPRTVEDAVADYRLRQRASAEEDRVLSGETSEERQAAYDAWLANDASYWMKLLNEANGQRQAEE